MCELVTGLPNVTDGWKCCNGGAPGAQLCRTYNGLHREVCKHCARPACAPVREAARNLQLFRTCEKLDGRQAEGVARLDPKSARFVADVVERWKKKPFAFSEPQRQWVENLEERHLG